MLMARKMQKTMSVLADDFPGRAITAGAGSDSEEVEKGLEAWTTWASGSRKPHYERSTISDSVRHLRYLSRNCNIFSRESFQGWAARERLEGRLTKKKENEYTKYINRWGLFRQSVGQPWDKFEYVSSSRKRHKISVYPEKEAREIIKRTKGWTQEDIRNNVMVVVALNSGLRRAEIANLKLENIHRNYIEVLRGKGEKDRDVPIDFYTYNMIQKYLPQRASPDSKYLFTTRKGRVTEAYMERIAGQIRKKIGRSFRWQKCRHTYATRLLDEGMDIVPISLILGHEDVQTTMGFYVDYNQDKAIRYYRKKKPRMFKGD